MEPITLYELAWTSADLGDRSLVPHQYSALAIRGLLNMQFRSKLNEMLTKSAATMPLEVPELAAYITTSPRGPAGSGSNYDLEQERHRIHGGSSGSSGSETLLALYLPLRSTVSLVKKFFTQKLSLVARKTAKPLTREHLNRLTCTLALHGMVHGVSFPSRNAMDEFFADPDNRFMRVVSATTYVPPHGLLKALDAARTHIKYKPGGEGFHEAQKSFYEHAIKQSAKKPASPKKAASPKKKKSGSVCAGRPRSDCGSDPCKWAGPGPKGRQFCRISKNRKRSRP